MTTVVASFDSNTAWPTTMGFPSTSWYYGISFFDCRYKHEFRRYTRQQIMEAERDVQHMGMAPMDPCGATKLK